MLHAALCVVVPCLIGLGMFGIFELWEKRRVRKGGARRDPDTIDYLI